VLKLVKNQNIMDIYEVF